LTVFATGIKKEKEQHFARLKIFVCECTVVEREKCEIRNGLCRGCLELSRNFGCRQ